MPFYPGGMAIGDNVVKGGTGFVHWCRGVDRCPDHHVQATEVKLRVRGTVAQVTSVE